MDFTTFTTPTVFVALISAVVGLIVKAVRLQSKVDGQQEDIKQLTATMAETKATLVAHKDNSDIHFNERVSREVDKRNEQRFTTIEGQLREINGKLDRIALK